MPTKAEPRGLAGCVCARIGYAILLCQEHAPIPYELTDRGRRTAHRMRQWDAIEPSLIESVKARAALDRAARLDGRLIEARTRRARKAPTA